jgi:hypothetical protein
MNYPAACCGVSKEAESSQNVLSRQARLELSPKDAKGANINITVFSELGVLCAFARVFFLLS